jgi:hypothetical protein
MATPATYLRYVAGGRHMRHTGNICGRCGRCGHRFGVGFAQGDSHSNPDGTGPSKRCIARIRATSDYRKEQTSAEATRARLASEASDLLDLVDEDRLVVSEAMALISRRGNEDTRPLIGNEPSDKWYCQQFSRGKVHRFA